MNPEDEPTSPPPARSIDLATRAAAGKPRLRGPDLHAQAAAIMARRLFGEDRPTLPQLAAEFGVSRSTVAERLALARTDGVPDAVRQIFIHDLLPAAMAVVQADLAGDDPKLASASAWKVIEGLDAIALPAPEHVVGEEDTLEVFRERIRIKRVGPDARGVIDGTVSTVHPDGDAPGGVPGPPQVYLPTGGADRPSAEAADDTPGVSAGGGAASMVPGASNDASTPPARSDIA